jgi:hypothetical protein
MKKTYNDEVRVETPGGLAIYYVTEVSYASPQE